MGERAFGRFAPVVYLSGGQTLTLVRGRRVEVRTLTRENKISELQGGDDVDAALELLSHLQSGPPAVAAAAGWSAIESLLLGPGDEDERNIVAADRLASLVACSWPRAELTDLAWARVAARNDSLAEELRKLPTNRERAARIAVEVEAQGRLKEIPGGSDIAAFHRLGPLWSDPRTLLLDIRSHCAESLRRLYRQLATLHRGRRRRARHSWARLAAAVRRSETRRSRHGFGAGGAGLRRVSGTNPTTRRTAPRLRRQHRLVDPGCHPRRLLLYRGRIRPSEVTTADRAYHSPRADIVLNETRLADRRARQGEARPKAGSRTPQRTCVHLP